MQNHKILIMSLAVLTSTQFFSCSKESDTAKLQEAQLCLNRAAQSEALSCVSKIESDYSPLAYSLRCSAIFISQGFGDAADFITALDSINDSAGCTGCSSTVNAINSLKFSAGATSTINNQNAENAFNQCKNADATIYTQIASLFRIGTLAAMITQDEYGGTYTQDQLAAKLASLDPTTIGQIVTTTYSTACSNLDDASESTVAYCNELQAAFNSSSDATAIGNCLIDKLQNPNATCP